MAVSADPVRCAVSILRRAGFQVSSDTLPPQASLPRAVVKMIPGESDEDYLPYATYSVDILTYGQRTSQARRLALRIYDTLKATGRQEIAEAGLLNSASCSVKPFQIYDNRDVRWYFVQTWDLRIGQIAGVD